MSNTECPRCKEDTISLKERIMAGKWKTITCPNCNGRMCAQPTILALLYFILTWNFIFFGYMAVRESSIAYAATLVVGWLILEFFIFYVPLCNMRALKLDTQDEQDPESNSQ